MDRWVINKIGLINFWLYDEEEFSFENGKLLLRGTNGSGKSVTTQSFIPLLLDGNKRPERIDPFGKKARRMEDYLLGDGKKTDSTGYLYMELLKKEKGHVVTIGMGLRARAGGKPVDFWGFIINDGRRIGKNEQIQLYKDLDLKVPLNKNELKNLLGSGGEIYEKQEEYMSMVNRAIFGFEQISDYEHLINLLIQLRSPKLSTDFKPTVIYEILNSSLQTLSDEDLMPMATAIEHMDNMQVTLENLKKTKSSMDRLRNTYNKYNVFLLIKKAKQYRDAYDEFEKGSKKKETLSSNCENNKASLDFCVNRIEELERESIGLRKQIQDVGEDDLNKIEEELKEREDDLKASELGFKGKESQLDKKKNDRRVSENQILDNKNKLYGFEKKLDEEIEILNDLNEELMFYDHDGFISEVKELWDNTNNFNRAQSEFESYQEKINQGLYALKDQVKCSEDYNRKVEEGFKAELKVQKAQDGYNQAVNLEYKIRDEWVENLYSWSNSNKEMNLTKEKLVYLTNALSEYKGLIYSSKITKYVEGIYSHEKDELDDLINQETVKISGLLKNKRELEVELNRWKSEVDPEPPRAEKRVKFREKLKKMKIPFIPLYKALDFRDNIDDKTKNIIEESLLDMGFLDSIIIPKKYENPVMMISDEGMGDLFVFGDEKKPKTSKFFKVDEDLNLDLKSAVSNVLEEISFGLDGNFKLSILNGKISKTQEATFIGLKARENYRLLNIKRLESLIEDLNEKMKDIKLLKDTFMARKSTLREEFERFPSFIDLDVAISEVKEHEQRLQISKEAEEKASKETEFSKNQLEKAKSLVYSITKDIPLAPNLECYENASLNCRGYLRGINNLRDTAHKCEECSNFIKTLEEKIQSLDEDMDDIYADMQKFERDISIAKSRISSINELLNSPEVKRSVENLKSLKELLRINQEERENRISERSSLKERIANMEITIMDLEQTLLTLESHKNITEDIFNEELKLGYVEGEYLAQNLNQTSKNVLKMQSFDVKEKSVEEYNGILDEEFRKQMVNFTEYAGMIENIFTPNDDYIWQRKDITFNYNHQRLNFNKMISILIEIVDEQENLLKEEDRRIFEEILSETLSRKLSARITSSKAWVKKMNSLMEGLSTSMGLTFSLIWREKQAEQEDEISTKRLVNLLQADRELLSDDDKSSLTSHFRAKVKKEKKLSEQNGLTNNYFEMIRDALDFRNWFEFNLQYKITGEEKKELTDRVFYRLSGGERAMAMYVPLFAAVYARYESAEPDALRIISLDEAFAGVDDVNIGSMFKLLEDLDLNYLINSQVLWGCYGSVPSLSICDLKRPNNSDIVTIIRYKWNGIMRELVV